MRAISTALASPTLPPEITQTLLNLAEFMERADKPIGIAWRTLGTMAQRCNAYAKALHYVEIELDVSYTPKTIEALISINTQLSHAEAAKGVLEYARQQENQVGGGTVASSSPGSGVSTRTGSASKSPSSSGVASAALQAKWQEQLGDWTAALQAYERAEKENHSDEWDARLGRMRCHAALDE